jgi:ketosteroid isomerase-like protein
MSNAQQTVRDWLNAIENRDVDRILDVLAEDITIQTELGPSLKGKQPMRDLMRLIGAYESIRIEAKKLIASERDVAVLARIQARFRDNIDAFGMPLPVAGQELNLEVALFCEVNEAGKLTRLTRIQNLAALSQQLGIPAEQFQQFAGKLLETARST